MIDVKEFNRKSEALSELLQTKLGLRGKTLAVQLRKAGPYLPKRLRKAGQTIVNTHKLSVHPRLSRMGDPAPVNTAFQELTKFLKDIDPSERRKTMVLRWLGMQVVNLAVIGVLVVLLLRWQGVI